MKGLIFMVLMIATAQASAICDLGAADYSTCKAVEDAEYSRRMEKVHEDTMRYYYESERQDAEARRAEEQNKILRDIAESEQRIANGLRW